MNLQKRTTRFSAITSAVAILAFATATVQAPGTVNARGVAEDLRGTTTDFDISAMYTDGPPSGSIRLSSKNDRGLDEVTIVGSELEKLVIEKDSAHLFGPAVMRKPGPVGPAEYHGAIEIWVTTTGDRPSLRGIFHSVEGYDAWEFNGLVTRGTVAIEPPGLIAQ
ncbi:MAG: hypothetical protein KF812_09150 [Fimbriimonadaceae bacterium]|nr:hypothetical protein [Fimbriimonadaceae bacterium]